MSDFWKVGIELLLKNSLSGALSVISRDILGLKAPIKEVEKAFHAWGPAAVAAISLAGGAALAAFTKKLLENGAEVQRQIGLLKNLGKSDDNINQTISTAQRAAINAGGTTVSENIGFLRELSNIFPKDEEARQALSLILPDAIATARATGIDLHEIIAIGAKATELRGDATDPETKQFDPARFVKGFRVMEAAIQVGNGQVDPKAMLGAVKQAGPLARMIHDPEEFWGVMMAAIIDQGGQRAGTGYAALGRQLIGGKMTYPTAMHMVDIGALDGDKVHKQGGGVSLEDGAWTGHELLDQGQIYQWLKTVFEPLLKSHGITTQQGVIKEILQDFGTQTGQRMAAIFTQNDVQIDRDRQNIHSTIQEDWYKNMMANDLGANISAMSSAFTNLMQTMGGPLVPIAIEALQAVTGALNNFFEFLIAHPIANQVASYGSAGLSMTLGALGLWKGLSWFRSLFSGASAIRTVAAAAASVGGIGKVAATAASVVGIGTETAAAAGGGVLGMASMVKGLFGPGAIFAGLFAEFLREGALNAAKIDPNKLSIPSYNPYQMLDGKIVPRNSAPSAPFGLYPGAAPAAPAVNVSPNIQATNNIYLDGRKIAQEILPLIIGKITATLTHPTSAPMANSSDFRPSFDGAVPAL